MTRSRFERFVLRALAARRGVPGVGGFDEVDLDGVELGVTPPSELASHSPPRPVASACACGRLRPGRLCPRCGVVGVRHVRRRAGE